MAYVIHPIPIAFFNTAFSSSMRPGLSTEASQFLVLRIALAWKGTVAVLLELLSPAPEHAQVDAQLSGDGTAVSTFVGQTDGLALELRCVLPLLRHGWFSSSGKREGSAYPSIRFNGAIPVQGKRTLIDEADAGT